MQHCYGHHNVSQKSVNPSGLSILMNGIISLPGTRSYDKRQYYYISKDIQQLIYITPGNFYFFYFLLSADIFEINKYFLKILTGIGSKCQTVWTLIQIWIQTNRHHYQVKS